MTVGLLSSLTVYVASAVGAAYAHEFTHYAVARACGLDAAIHPISLDLYTSGDVSLRGDLAIGLAPVVVGLAVAAFYVGYRGIAGLWSVPGYAAVAWGIYTLYGGSRDFEAVREFVTVKLGGDLA